VSEIFDCEESSETTVRICISILKAVKCIPYLSDVECSSELSVYECVKKVYALYMFSYQDTLPPQDTNTSEEENNSNNRNK
jgi:hypothetical protein